MKLFILVTLLSGSFSTFAKETPEGCYSTCNRIVSKKVRGPLFLTGVVYSSKFTRTCKIFDNEENLYYEIKTKGRTIVGIDQVNGCSRKDCSYSMERREKRKIEKQNLEVLEIIDECNSNQ